MTLPARAATESEVDALLEALRMHETLDVMREEGLLYADELAEEMLASGTTPGWRARVADIYDPEQMYAQVRAGFIAAIGPDDVTPLIDFLTSEQGARIVTLEISARRAQLDKDVEEAASARYHQMLEDGAPRIEQTRRFIEANDLIEANVVGSLNSNFRFYLGLMDGAPATFALTQDQALRDVWEQESEIRANTEDWLYSFLLMAYQPLPDGTLEDYIALSLSPDGALLNRALFGGFDPMFADISYQLGLAVAMSLQGQDL